jgi:hypothetical protein
MGPHKAGPSARASRSEIEQGHHNAHGNPEEVRAMRTREERQQIRRQRKVDKALAFHQCPFCSYDLTTGEGERSCHYYDCPYLPDLLDVACPDCRYNFFTKEGDANCGDPPRCDFARNEAPVRVETLKKWLELHEESHAAPGAELPRF